MKPRKLAIPVTIIMALMLSFSCGSKGKNPGNSDLKMEPSVIEVSIGGMTCTGCEQTIQTSISKLEGIKSVKASFVTGKAMVEYFPGITDTLKIKSAVTGSGYTVKRFAPVAESNAVE